MSLAPQRRKPRDILFGADLTIEWRDGVISHYPLFSLRDACPCAGCVNELTGEKILDPTSIRKDIGITTVSYVGNYAIRIGWNDGHDTGLYSFRFLRDYFEIAMEKGGIPGGPYADEN